MAQSIHHLLNRMSLVRQLLDRERAHSASTMRIMRLNANLLKLQQRLLVLVGAAGKSFQPVPIAAPVSRRHVRFG